MPFGLTTEKKMNQTVEDYKAKTKKLLEAYGVKPEEQKSFMADLENDESQAPAMEAPKAGEAAGEDSEKAAEGEKKAPEEEQGNGKAGEAPNPEDQGEKDKIEQQQAAPSGDTEKLSMLENKVKDLEKTVEAQADIAKANEVVIKGLTDFLRKAGFGSNPEIGSVPSIAGIPPKKDESEGNLNRLGKKPGE